MPQLRPQYWITMILWTLTLLIILINYAHLVLLPSILRIKLIRNHLI